MSKRAFFSAVWEQTVCFFRQTFRRHTGEEYSEFLTRGVRRGEAGVQRAYPWFYIRLFSACVILFAVYLLIVRFTSNTLFTPVTVMIAALTFNIPFIILLYEIYPRNDLSLLSVFVTLLVGGTGACVLSQILFSVIPSGDSWLSCLRTAGVEEFSKAAAAIICIMVVRVKHPIVGFIMGAAVGCGFSVVEDAGYIFAEASYLPEINITATVFTFFDRGLTAFCTHTVWTALIGWAFSSARSPFASVRLYGSFIFSAALHFLWNSPLTGWGKGLVIAACVIAAAAAGIAILAVERRAAYSEAGQQPVPEFFSTDERSLRRDRLYYAHAGHLSLTFGAFIMAVIAIIYCAIPFRETYYTRTFEDKNEFISFMQADFDLVYLPDRPFDPDGEIVESSLTSGVVTSVTQMQNIGGHDYYFSYTVAGDGQTVIYIPLQQSVELDVGGVTSRYFAESVYNLDGTLYASYFHVRTDVTGLNISADGSEISAVMYDPLFEYDYSLPQYSALFAVLGGLAGISLALYIVFYVLSRRKNNV